MTAADREFALKALDESRERLRATVRGLSREQLEYRPAPNRWSVAECVEHIILAEKFVLGRLEGLARQAPDSSKLSNWEGRDERLVRQVAEEREGRVQAPEAFRPIGRWPIGRVVAG